MLGLPIEVSEDVRQPLGVVVIVKALDADGEVIHWISKTEDITRIEAVGMTMAASDEFRAQLLDLPRSG